MSEIVGPSELVILDTAAKSPQDLEIAYTVIQMYAALPDRLTCLELTSAVLLRLVERDLITAFRAPRSTGYGMSPTDVEPLSPAQLREECERDRDRGFVPSEHDLVFIVATDGGRALLAQTDLNNIPEISGVLPAFDRDV